MSTDPTDDRSHLLDVAVADLSVTILQLRVMLDSIRHTLEQAGYSSVDVQAVASFTHNCQIQALEVSRRSQELLGDKHLTDASKESSGTTPSTLLH